MKRPHIHFLNLLVIAVIMALPLTGCAGERLQDLEIASAANSENSGPALWQLNDEDTTVYLFGTVHILKPDIKWQTEMFLQAFQASDVLYQEANLDDKAQQRLAAILPKLAFYADGRTLRDVLDAPEETTVIKLAQKLRMPLATLDRMKPWFASLGLSQMHFVKNGYRADNGVEQVLTKMANKQNKSMRYLETGEQQLRFLAELPQASQISFLVSTANSIEEDPKMLDRLVKDWATGDISAIAALLSEPKSMGDELVYTTMLVDRNQRWTDEITTLMEQEPGTFMFAVGAAHFAGDDSVIAMLRKDGQTVTRQ